MAMDNEKRKSDQLAENQARDRLRYAEFAQANIEWNCGEFKRGLDAVRDSCRIITDISSRIRALGYIEQAVQIADEHQQRRNRELS